jgi:hypothetical protein
MKTKYNIGQIVYVRAKVNEIHADKFGVSYQVKYNNLSQYDNGFNSVFQESELADCLLEDADDMISRAELFNKLATVNAPMEANAYKAEVYRIINEM